MDEVKVTERRVVEKGAVEGKNVLLLLLLEGMAEILPDNTTSQRC